MFPDHCKPEQNLRTISFDNCVCDTSHCPNRFTYHLFNSCWTLDRCISHEIYKVYIDAAFLTIGSVCPFSVLKRKHVLSLLCVIFSHAVLLKFRTVIRNLLIQLINLLSSNRFVCSNAFSSVMLLVYKTLVISVLGSKIISPSFVSYHSKLLYVERSMTHLRAHYLTFFTIVRFDKKWKTKAPIGHFFNFHDKINISVYWFNTIVNCYLDFFGQHLGLKWQLWLIKSQMFPTTKVG